MKPLPNVKLARPQNFRCHLSATGFLWNHQIQTASTATGSNPVKLVSSKHSSTGFMTSWICSGSFKVFNSHPMIQVSQRSARSCPMFLSRSVVSCAAHVEMHPSSKTLKKLRCITQALVNACCVGEPFDLLVHVPRIAVTLFSNPVKIPGML